MLLNYDELQEINTLKINWRKTKRQNLYKKTRKLDLKVQINNNNSSNKKRVLINSNK